MKIKLNNKVIASIIGIIISVLSFVIYSRYSSSFMIKSIIIFVCISTGYFQFYKYYFKAKNWDAISKVLITLILLCLYILFVFIIISVFCVYSLDLDFTLDYLMYAVFLVPVFLFVVMTLLFSLYLLSY